MNAPDALSGYKALLPSGVNHSLEVPARSALTIPFTFPGWKTSQIKTPILFAICKTDSVAPAGPTEGYARKAPKGVVKIYDVGHFDIYNGEPFEVATKDYIAFLTDNLPIKSKL